MAYKRSAIFMSRYNVFMKKIFSSVLCAFAAIFLSACGTPTPAAQSQIVNVYATSAAQFWLTKLYACAAQSSTALNFDASAPDIYLQVGEPSKIISPIYQIGEEEILVVVNKDSALQNLSLRAAQDLFAQENPSAQIWVFASGEDIQRAFDKNIMGGRRFASSAKAATSIGQLSAALNSNPSAVGILPKSAMNENLRGIFSAGVVPVLAISKTEPQGMIAKLIACLQK